jgi:membrane fusion protein (multidrug efflux system)
MKTYLYLSFIVLLAACSSGDTLEAKKTKLASLNSQAEELKTQITSLEKEIAKLDTSVIARKPMLVAVQVVSKGDFSHFVDIQGAVESENNVAVQPGMPGVVTKVYVKEGDIVGIGQILAEVDNRAIKESIAQLETNIDFAKTTFEKQERLWKQKIGSEIQYLQAKTQYESLQKSLASLRAQLDMSRMKSPIAGSIDQVNIKVGEYAAPGMLGAFNVVNFNKMKVVAKVADSYINKIQLGNPVKIRLNDINANIDGKISFVSKVVNSMTRTFTIEIVLGKTETNVRPNMLANVSINDENLSDVISINSNLVQKDSNDNPYVLVAKGSKGNLVAQKLMIKTGAAYGDKIVIIEGLNANDQLITSGFQEVVDGQPVTLN